MACLRFERVPCAHCIERMICHMLEPYSVPDADRDLLECGVVITHERLVATWQHNAKVLEEQRIAKSVSQWCDNIARNKHIRKRVQNMRYRGVPEPHIEQWLQRMGVTYASIGMVWLEPRGRWPK